MAARANPSDVMRLSLLFPPGEGLSATAYDITADSRPHYCALAGSAALPAKRDESHQAGFRQRVAPAMAGAVLPSTCRYNSRAGSTGVSSPCPRCSSITQVKPRKRCNAGYVELATCAHHEPGCAPAASSRNFATGACRPFPVIIPRMWARRIRRKPRGMSSRRSVWRSRE